jgi:hypothetical protein
MPHQRLQDPLIMTRLNRPVTGAHRIQWAAGHNSPGRPSFMLSFCFICKRHMSLLAFVTLFLFHSLT